jgi:FMN phosphatase YigB (HAD superfamily)
LASGSITWALQEAVPKFITANRLTYDLARLKALTLELQEAASRGGSPEPLAERLFNEMGWPVELQNALLDDVFSNYKPVLFEDATAFLERLRERNDRVLIVSNNPRTLNQVPLLEIGDYFHGVFTPSSIPGALPKPDRSMWDHIRKNSPEIDPQHTIVVGDDPWSEGEFAEVCGLQCWIVDRMGRFADVSAGKRYERVRSLLEIPL